MCEYCGYAPNRCYVTPTVEKRRHWWFDEEDYEGESDMTVEERDGMGNHTSMEDVKKVFKKDSMEEDAEIILSRNMGDALHYVYFRVEAMETVEVYSGGFGAETNFTKYKSLIDMDEYLTYLLFQDHYMVIGGLWRDTAFASINAVEVK